MYTPKHFDEPRVEVIHELIRARSLAALATFGSGTISINHIPLHLDSVPSPWGTLRGHVARANPVWKDLDSNVRAVAVFEGPDTYITPSWYATKAETGRGVPTWNYVVAHAHGFATVHEDEAWLRAHLESLTSHREAAFEKPWRVSDAPHDYIARMLAAIVGIEIVIDRLEGKWKVSQNQPVENQRGVVAGLSARGDAEALAVASLVLERGVPSPEKK